MEKKLYIKPVARIRLMEPMLMQSASVDPTILEDAGKSDAKGYLDLLDFIMD